MALTNAERQRKCRQKQKETNMNNLMKREQKRKREAYVPVVSLGKTAHDKRKKDGKKRFKKHYENKKLKQMVMVNSPNEGPSTSTRSASTERGLLTGILKTKGTSVRRRYKSSLKNANRKIAEFHEKNIALIRSNKRIQKRLQRFSANELQIRENYESSDGDLDTTDGTLSQPESPKLTSRSKTKELVDKLKLSTKGRRPLCKRLIFAECIVKDLKQSMGSLNKKIIGKLPVYTAKKYKLMSELKRRTGINRRHNMRKQEPSKQQVRNETLQKTIITFLNREDNTTVLVGKSDAVRINETEYQKRILNDYAHNLHEKFRLEIPEVKVSRATFYNVRPKYLLLANFASRRTWLCSRHQNIALKLKAIRALGISVSKSPDTYIKENDTNEKVRDYQAKATGECYVHISGEGGGKQ